LDHYAKDIEEKLAETRSLLSLVQDDHDRLLKEHEIAAKEADNLRNERSKMNFSGSCLEPNTEFSYEELMQATQGFNDLLKVREDEFGLAYNGTISCAFVCVKLLHFSCVSDRLRFKQEVALLLPYS
jgi:Rad3-related DNA helicase